MKNIKASVLIANYNNKKYIKDCLNSLRKQTFTNFEIIFHDDNSTDNSIKEVKQYNNIKIIRNLVRGKYGSMNQIVAYEKAFNICKGEIIFFLDSDDYFVKNKIKKIIKIFDKNKKIDAIYDLPILLINKKKKIVKNKVKLFNSIWPYIPPQSCISFRRSSLKNIFKQIKISNFYDIWMDFRLAIYLIYVKKNFFVLNQNLTVYRQAINSASYDFKFLSNKWWIRRMQAHKYVKFFLKKNKIKYPYNIDYYLTKLFNLNII